MHQLRFLLFTALIPLSASLLHGQSPNLGQGSRYGDIEVCNDGTIPFSVVRAGRDAAGRDAKDMFIGSDQWIVEGWFSVDPWEVH